MKKIAVINGPNLNFFGKREKQIYGSLSLEDINKHLKTLGQARGLELSFMQSNVEGELINYIHELQDNCDFIIINAGAYTHTSIALRDALLSVALPFIEVHLSNVDKREDFRQKSYLSDVASGVIYGFGALGYELALNGVERLLG
jgi:3-dehydroquinate dehydratase-2